ncbi:MAG: FkbM family methyltransferase, partial [Deltaproteobacteria bacterium]
PDLIEPIKQLYALNKLKSKIELRNQILLAGPDQPKAVSFTVHRNFLGSGMGAGKSWRSKVVEVPTTDYETLRKSFKPTVLIMDIEGAESEFFQHANLDGIRAIVVEFHPKVYGRDVMRACKQILTDAGFELLPCSTRLVCAMTRKL